ncbi:MAG TPA: universal stress protein [Chloroflexia bacterium]|nr:universal stress protein [Chloroflexia bacterium]
MRVVLCLSGLETAEFAQRAVQKLPAGAEVVLLYVVDTRPAEELNFIRRTHLFGGRTGSGRATEMQEAERSLAAEVLEEAAVVLGPSIKVADRVILEGRPEREIVTYVDQHGADLLVIGTRYRSDLTHPAPPPPPPPKHDNAPAPPPPLEPRANRGPHTIGPIARFIIDHALCDLLVLK